MKRNANNRFDDGMIQNLSSGGALARFVDANGMPLSKEYFSLGAVEGMSLQFNKEQVQLTHSLSDKVKPFKTITTGINPVLTIDFKDYKTNNIKLALNATLTDNESETETIELEITEDILNNGAFIATKQAIGELSIKSEDGETVYVDGLNYEVNYGNLYILSGDEQSGEVMALGDTIVIENKGLKSQTLEYEEAGDTYLEIYLELYNSADRSVVSRYKFYKAQMNTNELPIKGDSTQPLEYQAEFTLLESNAIKGSGKSRLFSTEIVKY